MKWNLLSEVSRKDVDLFVFSEHGAPDTQYINESKVLDSYIPNVAQMKDQLQKYNVAFTKTAAENEKLKEKNKTLSASLDKAKEGSVLKRLEDAKLRQDYEAAVGTLESIPPEVIQFYQNGGQIRGNNTEQEVNPHEEHRS